MPVPPSWYTDQAVFANEMECVFGSSWQYVADAQTVRAAGGVASEVLGEPVLVTWFDGGGFRAMSGVCRHRAGPVRMRADSGLLQCGYHGWCYGLDGELRDPPGRPARLPEFALHRIGPLLFACLAPTVAVPPDYGNLDTLLAPLAAVRPVATLVYEIAANWKIVVENFAECYHCETVHAESLSRIADVSSHELEEFDDHVVHHTRSVPTHQFKATTAHDSPTVDRLTYWLYPNLGISIVDDRVATFHVVPRSPERTTVHRTLLASHPSPEDDIVIEQFDTIMREDIVVVEAVQANLRSRFLSNVVVLPDREPGVAHFHRWMSAVREPR